jgi:ankyrin repeat protein
MRRFGVLMMVGSIACLASESNLIDAIKDQDRKAVMALIRNHSDVNAALRDGSTPLAWAAYENDAETVDLLLKAGAKVNVANE